MTLGELYGPDVAAIHDAGYAAVAEAAAATLCRELAASGHERGTVVDLGCGSGQLAARLASAGYDVLGIDLSRAMVARARRRAPAARFVVGSFLEAEFPVACVGVAAVGEVLNYVHDDAVDRRALRRLWQRVHSALVPGGVFILDLAGPGTVPGGSRQLHRIDEDWAILVDLHEAGQRLTRRITAFRRRGGSWSRTDEVHHQRLVPPAEVAAELRRAGFAVRGRRGYGDLRLRVGSRAILARRR